MLSMDMITTIKNMYEAQNIPVSDIAETLNKSRTTIWKYINGGEEGYHRQTTAVCPKYDSIKPIVEQWLKEDEQVPRKHRRTRWKIFEDLKSQYHYTGGYSTVKKVVNDLKGMKLEVYVPRQHNPGEFGEYDLGDISIRINGELIVINLHGFQLTYSNDIFGRVSVRAIQEEMFESHQQAFRYFEGIPLNMRYDNLKQAVSKVLRGRERLETIGFKTFRTQFGFDAHFCAVARGQEKGDVEGCIGYIRRNFFSPIIELNSLDELDELNQRLANWCRNLRQTRIVYGTQKKVGEAYSEEKGRLLCLPNSSIDVGKLTVSKVNHYSLICIDNVFYSVPVAYAHQLVDVLMGARQIIVKSKEQEIARHNRSWEKGKQIFDPLHYLPLFRQKPYALLNSKPISELPKPFQTFFKKASLKGYSGVKDCLNILELLKNYRISDISDALELAMAYETYYAEGVKNLLIQLTSDQPVFGKLTTFKRPELADAKVEHVNLNRYNSLILN